MDDRSATEQLQKAHFDAHATQYALHYGDPPSQAYRLKFINEPMLRDLDLAGLAVLDAMCGSGETTEYLLSRGARVSAIDISAEGVKQYTQRWPQCAAYCASIFACGLPDSSYDCAVVVGGLHHLHPDLPAALKEIHRVLKPGGYLCFMEPHAGSLPDLVRRYWYRQDHLFAANEAAIDVDALKRDFADKYTFEKEEYKGNIAYLLVLNSLVFRIPVSLKKFYSPLLLRVEALIEQIQGKRTACFVVCRWRKRA